MPGSDSSQYTAFKRYSSALVNSRTDNKSISRFYTSNPRDTETLGLSFFLPSLTKINKNKATSDTPESTNGLNIPAPYYDPNNSGNPNTTPSKKP
jgi:hypothetical protein